MYKNNSEKGLITCSTVVAAMLYSRAAFLWPAKFESAKIQTPQRVESNLAYVTASAGSTHMPNLVKIRPAEAYRQCGDVSPFQDFSSHSLITRTAQTERLIIAADGMNDVFWCKEVPFLHFSHKTYDFEVTILKNRGNLPPNRKFLA